MVLLFTWIWRNVFQPQSMEERERDKLKKTSNGSRQTREANGLPQLLPTAFTWDHSNPRVFLLKLQTPCISGRNWRTGVGHIMPLFTIRLTTSPCTRRTLLTPTKPRNWERWRWQKGRNLWKLQVCEVNWFKSCNFFYGVLVALFFSVRMKLVCLYLYNNATLKSTRKVFICDRVGNCMIHTSPINQSINQSINRQFALSSTDHPSVHPSIHPVYSILTTCQQTFPS